VKTPDPVLLILLVAPVAAGLFAADRPAAYSTREGILINVSTNPTLRSRTTYRLPNPHQPSHWLDVRFDVDQRNLPERLQEKKATSGAPQGKRE